MSRAAGSAPLQNEYLPLAARRWYAQVLTDAIHRRAWTTLAPPQRGEPPQFRTLGGNRLPPARILHTTANAVPRAGIPRAHIKISQTDYDHALRTMTPSQRHAWLWHVEPRKRDRRGDLVPPSAIFEDDGGVIKAAPCHPDLAAAALIVIEHATIQTTRDE